MKDSIHGVKIYYAKKDILFDAEDNPFIDFTSGIFSTNLGFNLVVRRGLHMQASNLIHCYNFGCHIRDAYLQALCEFTGFESAYMFSSGTEAVEAAWKIARMATGRPGIWGLTTAFHGKTFGAQIAAGLEHDWRNQTPGDKTGCIIFEPYVAATVQFHSQEIIDQIIKMKKEFNLLLIADEIQAGFGRTGKLFGYQHYPEIKPDIVCIGKGMANGFPASAILGPSSLVDDPSMDLSSTNGGNPLACAAGMATIEEFKRLDAIKMAEEMGTYFIDQLTKKLTCPVQGRGMVASLWFDSIDKADQVVIKCAKKGLLVVHTKKQTVKLGPPLITRKANVDAGIRILQEVVNA